MKKFTLIVFALLCFGVVKAHMPRVMTPGLKPSITIVPINNLADYNVTFRFVPKPYYGKKEMISVQNKIATITSATAIKSSSLKKDKSGFLIGFSI